MYYCYNVEQEAAKAKKKKKKFFSWFQLI